MDNKLAGSEKIMIDMLIKWIDKMDYLDNSKKELLLNMSIDLLNGRKTAAESLKNSVDTEELNIKLSSLGLNEKNRNDIVCALTDFMEEVLPIGSVIVLKDDFIKSKDGSEIKIIINKRFLCNEKAGIYFTYSGALYPSGELIENKLINFNKECISKVYYQGFNSVEDERYVLALKNEIIFNKNIHSVIFADDKQLDILKKEAAAGEEN